METSLAPTHSGTVYSGKEELFNCITHGIGALLSIAGLVVLLVLAAQHQADAWQIVSFSIYGGTLTLLYLASTLYHSIRNAKAKKVLRLADHISIFVFIIGSYTPVALIMMRDAVGWSIYGGVLLLGILGIVFTLLGVDRFQPVCTAISLAMGWLVVFAIKPMLAAVPLGFLAWMLASGICYSLGVIFFAIKKIPFHHGIWHLFVIAGSATYYVGICRFFV
jgi:hemolysin III